MYWERWKRLVWMILWGFFWDFQFACGMEIIWHKSVWRIGAAVVLYQGWLERYQWKWAANGYLFKLLGTPFGLKLKLHDVDQFIVGRIKAKLEYRSSTHLSCVGITLIVNKVMMSSLSYFIAVWACAKKVLRKVKAMLCNYLWSWYECTARARVCWNDCVMPKNTEGLSLTSLEDAMHALVRK